jgi:hypothetical protein
MGAVGAVGAVGAWTEGKAIWSIPKVVTAGTVSARTSGKLSLQILYRNSRRTKAVLLSISSTFREQDFSKLRDLMVTSHFDSLAIRQLLPSKTFFFFFFTSHSGGTGRRIESSRPA